MAAMNRAMGIPVYVVSLFAVGRARMDTKALFTYLIRGWPNLHSTTPNTVVLLFFSVKNCSKID
jgi:hypothetical protein